MVIRLKFLCLLALLLSSCAIHEVIQDTEKQRYKSKGTTEATIYDLQSKALLKVLPPKTMPVVAVYGNAFTDQTGQRKSNSEFALFSTAVTQAPSALLVRALKHAADGKFFVSLNVSV